MLAAAGAAAIVSLPEIILEIELHELRPCKPVMGAWDKDDGAVIVINAKLVQELGEGGGRFLP